MEVTEMLDRVAELKIQKVEIEKPYLERIKPYQDAIGKIQDEKDDATNSVDIEMAYLQEQIEDAVLEYGETIKSDRLMAVYYKGKVSWDTKKLEGLALAHPEIEKCKTQGEPYVQFREIKKNGT